MVTASIVTYNTNPNELSVALKCAIDSLISKIYIIDNSPNNSISSFANLSPKIEYIYGHGNVGYGAAHNIGIKQAIVINAKYHIVLNPDIIFNPESIETIMNYMDINDDIGQIMPKVLYPDGELQYLCKLLPSPMDLIGRRFFAKSTFIKKRDEVFEMRKSQYNKIMYVPFLSGCFMFLRLEALSEIGLFDDKTFFMYCEDLDLCRRIGEQYQTVFYPHIEIIHNHNKESFRNYRMLFAHMLSAIKYFNKWGWFFDKKRKEINKKTLGQLTN